MGLYAKHKRPSFISEISRVESIQNIRRKKHGELDRSDDAIV